MSPENRRITIAKDVIAQLLVERYRAAKGTWCDLYPGSLDWDQLPRYSSRTMECPVNQELQPIINSAKCDVCALGALFASAVGVYDNHLVDFEARHGSMELDHLERVLARYFPAPQLVAIEIAFEGGTGGYNWHKRSPTQSEEERRFLEIEYLTNIQKRFVLTSSIEEFAARGITELIGLFDDARSFHDMLNYYDPSARMLTIMQNIVVNNGEFKPNHENTTSK